MFVCWGVSCFTTQQTNKLHTYPRKQLESKHKKILKHLPPQRTARRAAIDRICTTMGAGARSSAPPAQPPAQPAAATAEPSAWQRFFAGLGPRDTASEFTRFCFGALFFAAVGPFVFGSALLSTLWEAADRGFRGGVFLSGQEQTGFLLGRLVPRINELTHRFNSRFVKTPQDSYMVNAVLLFGVMIPTLFVLCGLHTVRQGGVSWLLCLAYHQFRLGPFVMNFGWVYALSHREGHAIAARTGMWKPPRDKTGLLRYVFNYWIGLFFGVTPASFDVGHSIIHHKCVAQSTPPPPASRLPRLRLRDLLDHRKRLDLHLHSHRPRLHLAPARPSSRQVLERRERHHHQRRPAARQLGLVRLVRAALPAVRAQRDHLHPLRRPAQLEVRQPHAARHGAPAGGGGLLTHSPAEGRHALRSLPRTSEDAPRSSRTGRGGSPQLAHKMTNPHA